MFKLFLSYFVGGTASGLVMVLSTFLMTRLLTTEAYGTGMLFISLMNMLFFLCTLGMDQVFIRFFYEPAYKNKPALLLYRCLMIVGLSAGVVSLAFVILAKPLLAFLKLDNYWLIPALIMAMVLFTFQRFLQLIPRLQEKTRIYNLAVFTTQLLFLIFFLICFYSLTKSYWSIIYSQLAAMIMVVVTLAFSFKSQWLTPGEPLRQMTNKREWLSFLSYGVPSVCALSLTWLFTNLDKFFILKWSGYHELGIYTAAFALTAPLQLTLTTFNTAWAPRMNQMLIHRPFKSKKIFFKTFEKLCCGLTILFLLLIFAQDYLILFLGSDFSAAVHLFPWLLFGPYFRALSEVVFAGIVKTKKTYWHMFFSLCAVCTNIIGCALLIPRYGSLGAALSVALSFAVFFLTRWMVAFRYYAFKVPYIKLLYYISLIIANIITYPLTGFKWPTLLLSLGTIGMLERRWLLKINTQPNALLNDFNAGI